MTKSLLLLSFSLIAFAGLAQKQLIFLKRETVVARYQVGDYFRCKLKSGAPKEGKILALNEFTIITTNDTLDFIQLGKVRFPQGKVNVTSGIGGAFFVGGILYFALDQINTLFVDGQKGLDPKVGLISLGLTATGAAMLFLRPKYQNVWKFRVRTIDYTSPFYRYRN